MILGKRIRLRPVEKDDLPRFVKWLADAETRSYLEMHLPLSQVQEERWFERNLNAGSEQTWSIDLQPPDAVGPWVHIGSCGYHALDMRNRVGEAGILVGARDYWGKGFGTDALQTLVAWGFYTLNLNRVQLRVFADNERAIRSYQKVGFQIEGRLRQGNYANGAYRDVLWMGVLREDWAQALLDAKAA
ncbi:MAG: GNAT family N-acetyltransferase [Anaerolineales bacterium]|nr:GNAT family N-acetyltransferase [Anaerolineales bacterium]